MSFERAPHAMPAYLPALTGVRALAALLVLGLHLAQNLPGEVTVVLPFLARGYLGVDFFFFLSGFIITHVYLSNLARPVGRSILVFLWHRLIRLYPAHVTVLAGVVALVFIARAAGIHLNSPQGWRVSDLPWHLVLLHAWGVTETAGWNAPSWSISAEWFAYLLFPLLAPGLARLRGRWSAFALAVAALSVTVAICAATGWSLASSWVGAPALVRVAGEFLCGAAICRAIAFGAKLPARSGDALGAGAFAAFLVGASNELADLPLVVLLALALVGAATARSFLASLLGSRPLVWLGEVSYSLYIVHFPALLVIRRLIEALGYNEWSSPAQTLAFAGSAGGVIALAAVLFYLVERPARQHLRNRMGVLAPA